MYLNLESANPDELREALNWRVIDGVTTRPALMAQQGGDPTDLILELLQLVPGTVSVEITSTTTADMLEEAEGLAALSERLMVRIPCTSAGIPAIATLSEKRIMVDATLCFSISQALLAAKAGAHLISPPVGPMDAEGGDGLALMGAILSMLMQNDFKCGVQASQMDHPGHVAEAARMGINVIAVSMDLLRHLAENPFTTVYRRSSLEDWRRGQN